MSLARQILLDSPVAYWPCDDVDTTCRDRSGGGRNLTHSSAPSTDSMFGRAATARAFGSPGTAFNFYAVGGWFYFPATRDAATAYIGLVTVGSVHLNLSMGDVTGSLSNEMLTIQSGSNNFRAWTSASDSVSVGWHHLFASHRASLSRWEVFFDGVPKSNSAFGSAFSGLSASGTINLGSWSDGTTGLISAHSMKMAHVAYFGAEVSDDRIKAQFQAGLRARSVY